MLRTFMPVEHRGNSTTVCPRLPPELERAIFEVAALTEPAMIQTFLRLARRFRIWTEPLLYRVIWVDSHPHADKTYAAFDSLDAKPAGFFKNAVRHMYMDETSHFSRTEARTLLGLCENLTDLTVLGRFAEPGLLPILATIQLQRLTVDLADLFGGRDAIDFGHPLFTSITHLHIWDQCVAHEAEIYSRVVVLPALTHLCVNENKSLSLFRAILNESKLLQMVMDLWPSYREREAAMMAEVTSLKDPRFVVATMAFTGHRAYWAAGAEGGRDLDIWTESEDWASRRRAGEVFTAFMPLPPNPRRPLTYDK
ncbi:hypothetical protein DFH06DRAFT_1480526 [Mycena polygramma]|nr:hypothetical protein DFH06DRAFT_1480526 [Mycena polygramma]